MLEIAPASEFKLRPGMLVLGKVNHTQVPGKISRITRGEVVVDFSGTGYGFTKAMRRRNLQVVLTRKARII
ncbi:hypothetical protein LCGC14_1043110 [marine sediment metagenome]|uniref:KOW domain-containing protein n=1 Tax=marine sediment metagenome TaxID=412755 RepID=A0A0F9QXH4_9ZZZZ